MNHFSVTKKYSNKNEWITNHSVSVIYDTLTQQLNSGCRYDGLLSDDCLILETILKQFKEDFWGTLTFIK